VVRDNLDEQGGTIRVAAPQTLCTCLLIPVLARFVGLHPRTRIVIQERNSSATAQAVLDGTADLGLVHGWPANDTNLQVDLVARDAPVVVMPPGHPLSRTADVKPDALAAFPLIVTVEGCRYREYLDALLQGAPVRPHIRGVADSVPALVQMVSAGLGVSILPKMAVDTAETAARVELRALSTMGEGLPICLLTVGREPARHVAAFIEMVRLATASSDESMSTLDVKNRAGCVAVTK
jgi:DNA-binding transcriptional LysR family regulator